MLLSGYIIAIVATVLIAVVMRKSIRHFQAAISPDGFSPRTANYALLSVCLLVTWLTVLHGCVDVANGAPLDGLLALFAFHVTLALIVLNKLRNPDTSKETN